MRKELNKTLVKSYSEKFEDNKYPYQPYKSLVWDRLNFTDKYSVLGAWKTGCIRSAIDEGYKSFDFEGQTFYYTRRWKFGTPAQKKAWEKLNNSSFKEKLLQISNQKKFEKPGVYVEVNAIDGIGFIYTLFVLHCENPSLFPLYDQHVWRAYLYFTDGDFMFAKAASQSWKSYCDYASWFKMQVIKFKDFHQSELDRALWKFGKDLKKITK